MTPKICTAIVTFNRLNLLKDAITSIREQIQPTDILVVNNGSTDGTKEYLEQEDGLVVINQENVGGAGGFFTAMKYIAEHNYDFAWVMDDDIIAFPDTLLNLYTAYVELNKVEEIGFLCSTVKSPENETVNVPDINFSLNSTGYVAWNTHLDKGYVKVKAATFVSVFIPVKIIRNVGLPIKEFFIWGDDTEYTRRISAKYPCYLIGPSIIKHLRNGGILSIKNIKEPNRIKMFRYFIRNTIYNARVQVSRSEALRFQLSFFKQACIFFIKGEYLKSKIILKGIIQSIKFKPTIIYPKNIQKTV